MTEKERLIKIVWDYSLMHHPLRKADVILCLGSYDLRVPAYAADLFLKGYAPLLIFSGAHGQMSRKHFSKSEAETFKDIAIGNGVPEDKILIENKSTNTGENIQFTKALLEEKGLDFNTFLLVQKPYMERRAYATFKKIWPEKECILTSPPLSLEEYVAGDPLHDRPIHAMVRDIKKIKEYYEKGFQIYQEIPAEVWQAYEKLTDMGYGGTAMQY